VGVSHRVLLMECQCREENVRLYRDRHRDQVRQGLGVPGCGLRSGIYRMEHGKDSILGKHFPDKEVGRGELNVRFSLGPYESGIFRGVALVDQSNRCRAKGVLQEEGQEGSNMVHP
jgi:hypothetical protein